MPLSDPIHNVALQTEQEDQEVMGMAVRTSQPDTLPAAMGRRTFLFSLILLLAAGGGAIFWHLRASSPSTSPPDLLLITLDTVRADHLGLYGEDRNPTPNLDALGREGTWFSNAQSTAPSTLASHSSLFTSQMPHRHGVPRNGYTLDASAETLAEALKAVGYHTSAFVSSAAVEKETGIHQGFQTFNDDMSSRRGGAHVERSAAETNAAVRAWFEGRGKSSSPFFTWIHYFDAHYPYQPPRDLLARFTQPYQGRVKGTMRDIKKIRRKFKRTGEVTGGAQQLERLYTAEIAGLDREVGKLLSWLKERGSLDNAILVVTADHGETFWEHQEGAFDHGQNVYLTNIHVPLLVRSEAHLPSLGEIKTPVSLLDLAPTLLHLASAPRLGNAEGVDLAEVLRGKGSAPEPRDLFCEATRRPGFDRETTPAWPNSLLPRAVRRGNLRLIRRPGPPRQEELYPMENGALEGNSRIDNPDFSASLSTLQAVLDKFDASQTGSQVGKVGTDPGLASRLAALGYVDDASAVGNAQGKDAPPSPEGDEGDDDEGDDDEEAPAPSPDRAP